jgi:glycosyltransferase involved in cell wall biosynthesis
MLAGACPGRGCTLGSLCGIDMFSIVTPNRNRLSHLKNVLPTWQRAAEVDEIVIVDYGSDQPISASQFESQDKVRIVQVLNTDQWRIGHAINIGVDFASHENICKIDSDTLIDDHAWLCRLDFDKKFYRGHYQTTVPNGQALFTKAQWSAIGGYNEWLSGYGFDDSDFYIRMRAKGLIEGFVPAAFARSLNHGNDVRAQYKAIFDIVTPDNRPDSKLAFDQQKNQVLAFLAEWSSDRRLPYKILSKNDCLCRIETEPAKPHYRNLDLFSQLMAFVILSSDDVTKRLSQGVLNKIFMDSGGFGERPEQMGG